MRIVVTQEHIDKAIRRGHHNSGNCPVALALQEHYKDGSAGVTTCWFDDRAYNLPPEAKEFIRRFDAKGDVEPFEFEPIKWANVSPD